MELCGLEISLFQQERFLVCVRQQGAVSSGVICDLAPHTV